MPTLHYYITLSRGAARNSDLTVAIGGAEDMRFRRQHYVVESLSEHCCREESDHPQRFGADVDEIVPYRGWEDKNATRLDRISGAVFHMQLATTGNDVLRFFGGIGVPAKPASGLDLVNNRRRLGRPVSSIDHKSTVPTDRGVIRSSNLNALKFV
jgi:hypothetical protein